MNEQLNPSELTDQAIIERAEELFELLQADGITPSPLVRNLSHAFFKQLTRLSYDFPENFSLKAGIAAWTISRKHPWEDRPIYRWKVENFFQEHYGALAKQTPIPLTFIGLIDPSLYRTLYGALTRLGHVFPPGIAHDNADPQRPRPHTGQPSLDQALP